MENHQNHMLFGFAEVDTTPDWSVELVGFFREENRSKGIQQKLSVSVLVCQTNQDSCCIITIDDIGFTVELTHHLRDLAAGEIGCSHDQIMVFFSHTHSGPNAAVEKRYYDLVCRQVVHAIKLAQANLQPWFAAWGITNNTIGINRRAGKSIIDERLGILKFTDPNGSLKLLILRVTAHANVLSSDNNQISSDYIGTVRNLLEGKYQCHVMVVQGAAGDIRPKFQQQNAESLEIHGFRSVSQPYTQAEKAKYLQQSMLALQQMAAAVYESVDAVIDSLKSIPIYRLLVFSETRTFFADVPCLEEAQRIADEAWQKAGIDGTHWLNEVSRLSRDNILTQLVDIEIQYFVVNDGCLCGIPQEAMCEIALDITNRTNEAKLFFGAYVNGIECYLPTAEEYDKGGFEVLWSNLINFRYFGHVMPLNRDTAQKIAEIVSREWKRISKTT